MARLTLQRGLVTSVSELTRADGAAVVMDNVVIDLENSVQQRRGFREYSQLLSSPSKQVTTYKNRIIAHYENILAFDNGSGLFTNFAGNYEELVSGLRIKALEANGNFYFTTKEGVKKISVKNASDLTASTPIINAGAAKAIDLTGTVIPDAAGFLPAQSKVAYRVVFGYKDANSNLQRGVPSSRTILTNFSNDVNTSEIFTVNFLNFAAVTDGDYFTFNTLSNGYYVWYKKTGAGVAPVNADTLDKVGIEVDITSASVTTVNHLADRTANAISAAVTDVAVELSGSEVEVTITDPGDATDPSQGSFLITEVAVTKIFDGSITAGSPALAELNFTLPPDVDTTYFYQLYRTGVATVSAGVTLSDIDPGDEGQLVLEAPITAADVTAGEITIQDNTPETFRASGEYIYTAAINGQGITQANERPPIAQDMATFRNSTFYANTKDYHRFTFSILSVDNFVSGSTKFYIGRGDTAVEYTFVGVNEVTNITVDTRTNTVENSYITLNSANNERQYYLWFDKGIAPVDPALTAKTGIRVPLELYPNTIQGTKDAIIDSLLTVSDFSAVDFSASVVRISNTDSGAATNAALSSSPAPGGAWSVSIVTQGDGEDYIAKEVLLSTNASVGIAIDTTARSLQRVINKDPDSPVIATYLSGVDDLPGKLLLESKSLEDEEFYVAISDSSLSSEFSPELPANRVLQSVSSNVYTTTSPHGFVVGDEVYINDQIPLVTGNFIVATVPSATTFSLVGVVTPNNAGPLSGQAYLTTAASDNNEVPNRVMYSKAGQPEAVPSVNYVDVGSKDKAIFRILALRDNLFVLKEDGIYIVTGASAPNFSVRLLDNSAILLAQDSAVVLNNLIYCLTSQGVVSISDSGVSILSRNIEDQIKKVTTFAYNYKLTSFGVSYESDRAYLLWLPMDKTDTVATQCFRYSTITNTWTRWTVSATCGIITTLGDDRFYLGKADRNYIAQERKNGEREDYSDRDFTLLISPNSVNENKIGLSSVVEVEIGDVLVQEQYVDVPKFNRLLRKLDNDPGPADNDYYSSLFQMSGTNLPAALIALVSKLNSDANLGSFTPPSGINTPAAIRDNYNTMIAELNGALSGTQLKDYRQETDLLRYEVLVLNINKNNNLVTVSQATWFIEGSVQVYKAIKSEVQWSQQHFGEPEKFKQVSEGTLIFDQGTIYGGVVAFASDRSADFSEIEFTLDGPGFWAHMDWYDVPWGGGSNEIPVRTLVPQNKSRCRYLSVKFRHFNAREQYKLLGMSLEPREYSSRAYR